MDKTSLSSIQLADDEFDEHKRLCEFGIARTNIKLGNYKKGVNDRIAIESQCVCIENVQIKMRIYSLRGGVDWPGRGAQ